MNEDIYEMNEDIYLRKIKTIKKKYYGKNNNIYEKINIVKNNYLKEKNKIYEKYEDISEKGYDILINNI